MEKKNEPGILIYDGAVVENHQLRSKKPLNFPVARDEMMAAFFSYAMGLVILTTLSVISSFTSLPIPNLVAEMSPILLITWLTPIPWFIAYEVYTAIIGGGPL
jgi:hypothetical protein